MDAHAVDRASGFGEVVGSATAAPAVLLGGPPGLPTPWTPLMGALGARLRYYRWIYRQVGGGPSPGPSEHAAEVVAAVKGAGLAPMVLMAWDVGAQVALEALRLEPGLARALVVLNGVYGATYRPAARTYAVVSAALRGLAGVRRVVGDERLAPVLANQAAWPRVLKALRFVARPADDATVTRLARAMVDADADALAEFVRPFARHTVTGLWPHVTCPTLLITGERDRLSPPHVGTLAARELANAETFVVRDGTHVVTHEYPETVALRVEKFLRERNLT